MTYYAQRHDLDNAHTVWYNTHVAYLNYTENFMNAGAIQRKLKDLDALEERVKQTVNPSAVLLAQIRKEREELLNPKPEQHK